MLPLDAPTDFSQQVMMPVYDVHDLADSSEVLVDEKTGEELSTVPVVKHPIVRVRKATPGNTQLQINVIIRRENNPSMKKEVRTVLSNWAGRDVCLSSSNNYYKRSAPSTSNKDDRRGWLRSIDDDDIEEKWESANLAQRYENDLSSSATKSEVEKDSNTTTDIVKIVLPVHVEKPSANGKCRVLPSSMTAIGKFPCPHEGCSSILSSATALRKHRLIHQPKRFSCSKCEKEFVERTKLKRHMLVHTRVQSFACTHTGCTKQFALKSNLKAHMKIHTGEKQYKCVHCSHAFSHPYNLKVHVLRRHPTTSNPVP
ncbi:unnamed protein product [Auanema sp. JU1783]|nr:unnamed protein product [Auanema sp. JU1783]